MNEEQPIIYGYESSEEFTFITIDYTTSGLPLELLIDDISNEMVSLAGQSVSPLDINPQTAEAHLWAAVILLNDINQKLADRQLAGQWSCHPDGNNLRFQFAFSFPKALPPYSTAALLKAGIVGFRSSISRIEYFNYLSANCNVWDLNRFSSDRHLKTSFESHLGFNKSPDFNFSPM